MKRKIVVASNLLEKKNYGDYTFPIDFDYNTLFAYEYGFLDYHWHYEMILTPCIQLKDIITKTVHFWLLCLDQISFLGMKKA